MPGEERPSILRFWPEALQSIAILLGWSLFTWGVAALWRWEVWLLSGGLLLLSVAGWGHMKVLFGKGIYTLSSQRRAKKRG